MATSWLTDWSKRVKLTTDSTKIDSDLTDFPVALTLVSGTNTENVIMDAVVSGGITDNFNAPNGTPPNSALWWQAGTGSATTTDNKMRFSVAGGYSEGVNLRTRDIYYACGDFDAQIDWENIGGNPSTNVLYTYFGAVCVDGKNGYYNYYNWYPNWQFLSRVQYDGLWTNEAAVTITHNPTKLRIKRVGSTWSVYKWDGASWDTLVAASAVLFSTAPVYFIFHVGNATNYPSATVDFDNFQVTSDWAYYDHSKKIAVTTDDGLTQCPVEIQQWDMMERKAILWTKVPTITSGTDTNLYLYYDETKDDNETYVGTVNSAPGQDVWDSNFKAVYHMNQAPSWGSDAIKNSTLAINHGTSAGTMTSTDLVNGKIGKAIDFDGGDDYINCGTDSSLDNITNLTFEATVKLGSWGESGYGHIVSKSNTGNTNGWQLFVTTPNGLGFIADYATTDAAWYASSTMSLNTWAYVAVQYIRSSPLRADAKVYVDGDSKTLSGADASGAVQSDAAENLLIACRKDLDREFDGIIDEVRISNIHRSASWIKATYYSNWDTLLTYGAEELRPIFLFYGTVLVEGVPAARTVCLYRRATGALMGATTSSGTTGYFEVGSYYNEYHYVVILPELDEDYNLLGYDKIHPEI